MTPVAETRGTPAPRNAWLRALRRDLWLSNGTKLALTVMGDRMGHDGTVKYARLDLAAELGRSERAVQRHLRVAIERGWLHRVKGGHNGAVSVYQATLPAPSRETATSTQRVSLPSAGTEASRETPAVSLNRQGERSDRGAVERGAAPDPATSTGGEEEEQRSYVSPLVLAARKSWGIDTVDSP